MHSFSTANIPKSNTLLISSQYKSTQSLFNNNHTKTLSNSRVYSDFNKRQNDWEGRKKAEIDQKQCNQLMSKRKEEDSFS